MFFVFFWVLNFCDEDNGIFFKGNISEKLLCLWFIFCEFFLSELFFCDISFFLGVLNLIFFFLGLKCLISFFVSFFSFNIGVFIRRGKELVLDFGEVGIMLEFLEIFKLEFVFVFLVNSFLVLFFVLLNFIGFLLVGGGGVFWIGLEFGDILDFRDLGDCVFFIIVILVGWFVLDDDLDDFIEFCEDILFFWDNFFGDFINYLLSFWDFLLEFFKVLFLFFLVGEVKCLDDLVGEFLILIFFSGDFIFFGESCFVFFNWFVYVNNDCELYFFLFLFLLSFVDLLEKDVDLYVRKFIFIVFIILVGVTNILLDELDDFFEVFIFFFLLLGFFRDFIFVFLEGVLFIELEDLELLLGVDFFDSVELGIFLFEDCFCFCELLMVFFIIIKCLILFFFIVIIYK